MPRSPRVQFAGALYHVSNRGGYRQDVFATPAAARLLEDCLAETCGRTGWIVHAYAILRNHFQLAIETPQPNLAAGMHWLETTFCARFARSQRRRGHVFHGRYAAILIEPGPALCRVVNSIHLDPIAAGVATTARLEDFSRCSFRHFVRRGRPRYLKCERWMRQLGFRDNQQGWTGYRTLLSWLAADQGLTPSKAKRRKRPRSPL